MSIAQAAFVDERRLGSNEVSLVEYALSLLWPISETICAPVIERLRAMVVNPETSAMEVMAAARVLLGFSNLNLKIVAQIARIQERETPRRRAAAPGAGPICAAVVQPPPVADGLANADDQPAGDPGPAGRPPSEVVFEGGCASAVTGTLSGGCTQPSAIHRSPGSSAAPAGTIPDTRDAGPACLDDPAPVDLAQQVTHVELFREDPTPEAPAIERISRTRIRFRLGKGANLWERNPVIHAMLPPGPERDLILRIGVNVLRIDVPSSYKPP